MVFVAGISILSLSPGSPITIQFISTDASAADDDHSTHTFSASISDSADLPLASTIKSLFTHTHKLEDIQLAIIAVPSYFTSADRELVKTAVKDARLWELSRVREVASEPRVLTNRMIVHGQEPITDADGTMRNELIVEMGAGVGHAELVTTEVEGGYRFSERQSEAVVHGEVALNPETLFAMLVQPTLDKLHETPTECGSELSRVLVIDSSIGEGGIAPMFVDLLNLRFYNTSTAITSSSASPHHVAKMALKMYQDSLLPKELLIFDVAVLRLGIAKADGFVLPLIPRNNTIPTSGKALFTTSKDGQTTATIRVMVGMAPRVVDNIPVAEFVIDGITPGPSQTKGTPIIQISAEIDYTGITKAAAWELSPDGAPLIDGARGCVEMNNICGESWMNAKEIESIILKYEGMQLDEEAVRAEDRWVVEEAQGDLPE